MFDHAEIRVHARRGTRLARDAHFRFTDGSGSFTFVEGEPTVFRDRR